MFQILLSRIRKLKGNIEYIMIVLYGMMEMSWANTALKLERLLMIVRRINMYVVDKLKELHDNGKLIEEELDE